MCIDVGGRNQDIVLPIPAADVSVNVSGFDNNLSSSDVNVQLALNTLNNISIKTSINGFMVDKGVGNTDLENIEIGDRIFGWLDDLTFVAGLVTGLPFTTEGNMTFAINSKIF